MFDNPTPPHMRESFPSPSRKEGECDADNIRKREHSGLYMLKTGAEALKARVALIRASQKHIALQYYMLQDDLSGKILMQELLDAADRGVNIRILLDDLDFSRSREAACYLGCHDSISFRVFNPATTKHHPFPLSWEKLRQMVVRYAKRMHNKMLLVDGVVGMVGGRNLGDAYFGVDVDFAFSDIDALVMGPAVKDMEQNFELFWESAPAYTLDDIGLGRPESEEVAAYRIALRKFYELAESYGFFQPDKGEKFLDTLQSGSFPFHWGETFFAADCPSKVLKEEEKVHSPPVELLNRLLKGAKEEFVAVSPYFIPMEEGMESLNALKEQGVRVRVLTNSFSSTDIPVVHAVYSRYRVELLQNGVELFELKQIPGKRSRSNFLRGRLSSRSSLHAKVYVIDRLWVVFGSLNLDPRSWLMNTENIVAVKSRSLAEEVLQLFDAATHYGASYALSLQNGRVVFTTLEKERIRRYSRDPKVGVMRRLTGWFFSHIIPEHYL